MGISSIRYFPRWDSYCHVGEYNLSLVLSKFSCISCICLDLFDGYRFIHYGQTVGWIPIIR